MRLRAPHLAPLLLLAPALAFAGWSVDGKHKVGFHADGPAGFAIDGVAEEFTVSETDSALVFTVPVSAVTTGIDLRDDHMRKYAGAEQHPNVLLSIPNDQITWPDEENKKRTGSAQATFTLNGVEQPVTVKYAVKTGKTGVDWVAGFAFDTSKHGIVIDEYMGVSVDPKMSAQAKFTTVNN
ncbi:MAG: YceI family protein [Myxococcota bacterium]|nr:YceI family protein [Myxococcota bacterium]